MSKTGTAKGKGDRRSVIAAPAAPVTRDIVPGKLTDQDWVRMADREEAGDFIINLIEEVVAAADKAIHNKHIESQLIPYTVSQVKDALLQIIEWQFLTHDEGSKWTDASKFVQDNEPLAAVTDCWAQGAVPQTVRYQSSIKEEEEEEEEVEVEGGEEEYVQTSSSSRDVDIFGSRLVPDGAVSGISSPALTDEGSEQNFGVCVKPRDFTSPTVKDVQCKAPELIERTSGHVTQANQPAKPPRRPPKVKPSIDVNLGSHQPSEDEPKVTDQAPKIIPLDLSQCTPENYYNKKIPPSQLPSNTVNTVYYIVDQKQEAAVLRKEVLKARKKKPVEKTTPPKTSTGLLPVSGCCGNTKAKVTDVDRMSGHGTERLPLLLDSMHVAAGVTARERDVVKRGPKLVSSQNDIRSDLVLNPIKSYKTYPIVDVSEILDSHICVKSLVEPHVVPPINRSFAATQ